MALKEQSNLNIPIVNLLPPNPGLDWPLTLDFIKNQQYYCLGDKRSQTADKFREIFTQAKRCGWEVLEMWHGECGHYPVEKEADDIHEFKCELCAEEDAGDLHSALIIHRYGVGFEPGCNQYCRDTYSFCACEEGSGSIPKNWSAGGDCVENPGVPITWDVVKSSGSNNFP